MGQQDRATRSHVLFILILIATLHASFLWVRHNPRCFACFVTFNPHRKPLRQVLISTPIYRWENQGREVEELAQDHRAKSHGPVDGSRYLNSPTQGYMLSLKGYHSNKKQLTMHRLYPEIYKTGATFGIAWEEGNWRSAERGWDGDIFSLHKCKREFEFTFRTIQVYMKLTHILASWTCRALDILDTQEPCWLGPELVPSAKN